MVDALERGDVGVVATATDEHVPLTHRRARGGIQRAPSAAPRLDPRVALTGVAAAPLGVGIGVQVTRHVPGRDPHRAQQGDREVCEVLAHAAAGVEHLARRRGDRRAAGLVVERRVDPVARRVDRFAGRARTTQLGRGVGDLRVGRHARRLPEELAVVVAHPLRREVAPAHPEIVRARVRRLDDRRTGDDQRAVRLLHVERVHDRVPGVDVGIQRRRRVDVDAVRDRELTVEIARRDAHLVVRRVHRARVLHRRTVLDPHPPHHHTLHSIVYASGKYRSATAVCTRAQVLCRLSTSRPRSASMSSTRR